MIAPSLTLPFENDEPHRVVFRAAYRAGLAITWLDEHLNVVVFMPPAETDQDLQARRDLCPDLDEPGESAGDAT
jgi:hypothetical protein